MFAVIARQGNRRDDGLGRANQGQIGAASIDDGAPARIRVDLILRMGELKWWVVVIAFKLRAGESK